MTPGPVSRRRPPSPRSSVCSPPGPKSPDDQGGTRRRADKDVRRHRPHRRRSRTHRRRATSDLRTPGCHIGRTVGVGGAPVAHLVLERLTSASGQSRVVEAARLLSPTQGSRARSPSPAMTRRSTPRPTPRPDTPAASNAPLMTPTCTRTVRRSAAASSQRCDRPTRGVVWLPSPPHNASRRPTRPDTATSARRRISSQSVSPQPGLREGAVFGIRSTSEKRLSRARSLTRVGN
jgi:hypothetical protein